MRKSSVIGRRSLLFTFFALILILIIGHRSSVIGSDEIRSRSLVVVDATTEKILYAKNPHLKHPPASTAKLMTAIIVLEHTDLNDTVIISAKASQAAPHKAGFREGYKITIEKLLYAALVGSANDAAVALSEAVAGSEGRFVRLMNKKAKEIGAKNTKFINASGLPGSGQYTTAFDLAKIMSCALSYHKLNEIIGTRVTEISTENGDSIFLKNTNRLLWIDENLVGGKTGYTRSARHCFVCAAERGNDTVVVALLGTPSREGLWKETQILINRGFEVIKNNEEPFIYTKGGHDVKGKQRPPNKIKREQKIIKK
ncbi:MAG: D-alanyl-D-alanine carboxypeptidase [Nitrospirae bacterium]|jgi:serine-type D-Ala-D-Ala carboxypeptidase (penicillin-binding protein 5/6)|nr:D-alanyl-D-alanine carboxypeptidase [Nitrospirota bacterium]